MKINFIYALFALILLSGCSIFQSNTIIDWVDFIKVNGLTYHSTYSSLGRELTELDLGEEYSIVKFNVSKNVKNPSYRSKNGDAAFLDKGTIIYKVKGYSPKFRLAAKRDNHIILYESDTNPNAKFGSDYFDIVGKVKYIGINDDQDGTTEIARIDNKEKINRLVDLLLQSKIENENSNDNYNGTRYFLIFYLNDGTVTERAYWHDTGILFRTIKVPQEFVEIISSDIK